MHNDFATKMIDHTPQEVVERYRLGLLFVGRFDDLIHVLGDESTE